MAYDYALRAAKIRQAALRAASPAPQQREVPPFTWRKQPRRAPQQPNLWLIAQRIMGAVGEAIPYGDPIDALAPWVRQHAGLDDWAPITPLLDRAARKHLGVRNYNAYLISMWDQWNEICEPDQQMTNPWK